jgi:hypothetical protein
MRRPARSSLATVIGTDANSGTVSGPRGSGRISSWCSPGGTFVTMNVPSPLTRPFIMFIMPAPPPARERSITKPAWIGRPSELTTVPETRAMRAAVSATWTVSSCPSVTMSACASDGLVVPG